MQNNYNNRMIVNINNGEGVDLEIKAVDRISYIPKFIEFKVSSRKKGQLSYNDGGSIFGRKELECWVKLFSDDNIDLITSQILNANDVIKFTEDATEFKCEFIR